MKKLALIALVVTVAAIAFWWAARGSVAREVTFVRVRREALVAAVQTNGKVEPSEWVAVRAKRAGAVTKVEVEKGQRIGQGAVIAELEADNARTALSAARARYDQAKTELEMLDQGGRPGELAAIESSLASARVELENAREAASVLGRLVEKEAATGQELAQARERVRKAEIEIAALDKKRKTLVSPAERGDAEARMQTAQADAEQAVQRLADAVARSPTGGIVYDLPVRVGSYVQPGDLLAEVGRLEKVRVVIYVDEPELGRIREGMPVAVTWDAAPGREWQGVVENLPTQIVALGTRQVGEVIALVENPDLELPAGANINAALRTELSEDALVIPKQALHRQGDASGVFVLDGETVRWQPVTLGVANITHAAVLDGLSEGDAVALPAEPPLTAGEQVEPIFQ